LDKPNPFRIFASAQFKALETLEDPPETKEAKDSLRTPPPPLKVDFFNHL